ncbi:hypothetical protein FHG87_023065 [Trinorchestia longiramus]|nr:hypothetical protein FHG87_023065 [Trinorchestia longiramus]
MYFIHALRLDESYNMTVVDAMKDFLVHAWNKTKLEFPEFGGPSATHSLCTDCALAVKPTYLPTYYTILYQLHSHTDTTHCTDRAGATFQAAVAIALDWPSPLKLDWPNHHLDALHWLKHPKNFQAISRANFLEYKLSSCDEFLYSPQVRSHGQLD